MYLRSPYPDVPLTTETNVHHLFFHRPDQAEWKDYTLHIDAKTGEKRTFHEFLDRVRCGMVALGASRAEGGLKLGTWEDGEMIGIMSQNSMDYITLVHSLIGLTTPFALISSYSTPFELKHALELSRCTRLFVNACLFPVVFPVAKKVGIPSNKIYVLEGYVKGQKSFSDMISDAQTNNIRFVSARPAVQDTLAYLIFSSGTTGLPKAVMISHGNIKYATMQALIVSQAISEVYTPPPLNTPEGIPVGLGFLPLHHTYGLHYYAFRVFLQPCTLVLLSQWDIEVALKAIPKYRISQLPLIPSVVHQLVNHPNIKAIDFSSVQHIGSGAAYLPPDLAAKMAAIAPEGSVVSQGFGMSECTIAAISQPIRGALGRPSIIGSTGILLPGQEARILRDDGNEADVGEVGELYLRGGNIAMGYWNNEKATRETFMKDGWLRTGDRFKVDKAGNFFFADRAKDTLKVSGIQVSPLEIEDVLLAHPKKLIIDVTVAGVSGGRTSDEKVPHAWVVLSDAGKTMGVEAVKHELDTWHKENLSKYKWLRGGIEIVKQIPKSPTGKVLRRVLQDKYEQQAVRRFIGKL